MLHFAERFLASPFVDDTDVDLKDDRRNWFPDSEVAGKRKEIRDLILRLGGFA